MFLKIFIFLCKFQLTVKLINILDATCNSLILRNIMFKAKNFSIYYLFFFPFSLLKLDVKMFLANERRSVNLAANLKIY